MIEAILVLLLVLGFLALSFKDLISAVIALAVFSLLSALLFYLLHAPDVAIAEAAVGAGVATVVFIWVIGRTERREP
jgi:energy-converting hydrogenase B subunit D